MKISKFFKTLIALIHLIYGMLWAKLFAKEGVLYVNDPIGPWGIFPRTRLASEKEKHENAQHLYAKVARRLEPIYSAAQSYSLPSNNDKSNINIPS